MPTRTEEIRQNLETIRERVADAARSAGRKPDEVQLIAVSKTYPAEDVAIAAALGCTDFGENRVQELTPKMEACGELTDKRIRWHLIGTLQRNKVRFVAGKVALIHSVDTLKLLREIEKHSAAAETEQEVLLQMNIAEEESKHGFAEEEIREAVEMALQYPHLRLRGLMTMAPIGKSPEEALPVFERCREWRDKLREEFDLEEFRYLSMGMSQDFTAAIAAGATHVRIGSSIFGQRTYP